MCKLFNNILKNKFKIIIFLIIIPLIIYYLVLPKALNNFDIISKSKKYQLSSINYDKKYNILHKILSDKNNNDFEKCSNIDKENFIKSYTRYVSSRKKLEIELCLVSINKYLLILSKPYAVIPFSQNNYNYAEYINIYEDIIVFKKSKETQEVSKMKKVYYGHGLFRKEENSNID